MQNETRQPRRWAEVATSEQFRSLDPERQERARQLYFEDVVLPRVPAGMEVRARELFDQDSMGSIGQAGEEQGGIEAMDYAKEVGAGALKGTGAIVSGLGDMIRPDDNGLSNKMPDGTELPELPSVRKMIADQVDPAARAVGGWLDQKGQDLAGTKTQAAQDALANSTPSGDVLDPSSWDMGKAPSLAGYGLQMAGLTGQFVPQAGVMVATRGKSGQAQSSAMMAAGGLQAGGSAANEVEQRIQETPDAELQKSSEIYRALRQKLDEFAARAELMVMGRDAAFSGAAPVGALGGLATQITLGPLQQAVGGGVGKRLAAGLAFDAPAEGVQEVAETVAARASTNSALGEQRDLTEDTFGDALLGALGGAGHASVGAALGDGRASARPQTEQQATPEPAPAALPAPGLAALPAPDQVFYGDSQGNVQDTGPVRNVDGQQQPDQQARAWVNPQNDPANMGGGPGMDQQTPRGEPAPLEGQLQLGAREQQAEQPRDPLTIDAEPERAALPAPETIVVDGEGNAQRGPVAPQVRAEQVPGGRGMDQQAPTALPRDRAQVDLLRKANGKPFDAPKGAEASKAFREARAAGRQPRVVPVEGGYAIRLEPEQVRHEMRPLDAKANEAATSPTNELPAPTAAQIEAGNYKKGKVRVHGLELSIENPRGSERSGTGPDGTEWRHTMSDHYGYIRRTTGADGEQVDVYLGPQEESGQVFVVDQLNQQDGTFDEHKVMLGYPDEESAVEAYRSNFDADWQVGKVSAMPVAEFKDWLKGGDLAKPAAPAVPAARPSKPQVAKGPRRKVDRDRDSLLQAAIRLGGLKTEWRQDTTGDSKGNRHVPGVGALWSDKTGTSIDDMASLLDQHGYIPAGEMDNLGGVPWLQQALRDELDGSKHFAAESKAQQEQMEREISQRFADEQARLEDQREAEYARIEAEYGADIAAQARAYDEAAKAYDEQVLAEAQRFEDEYEQRQQELGEFEDALDGQPLDQAGAAARDEQVRGADARQDRQQRDPARPGQREAGKGGQFELDQQTEQSLTEQAAQQRAADQAKAEAQRQADQKAQADRDRADFTLTGSGRSADLAAARGQQDLLGGNDQLYRQGSEGEASPSGAQVSAEQLRAALEASPELAGVQVVQDFEDLPLSTRTRAKRDGVAPGDLRGVRSSGKTYVVASNHSSLADAIYTAVHEEVGHRGIRGLLGEELDATMERLYSSQQATAKGRQRIGQIRDAYASVLEKLDAKQQRVLVAQEMVAHLLEDGDRPTMLQRVLSKIRELLRQMFPQVPWTYTDILALGEQSRAWLRRQNGQPDADSAVLYSRRGWSEEFPDTVLAHPLSFLNNHPDYEAAKAGDDAAALRVARDAVTPEFVEQVRALIPKGSQPRIVPVLAVEGAGKNRIPLMAAEVLAQRLGLQTDTAPVQAEKVGRTQSSALERIANQPTFTGKVAKGDYLIIDDTLTQGGTLAQLKTHIEDNGGQVLGAIALTGKNYSRKLSLDPSTLAEVRGKYGSIEPWWRDTFGYSFEGLTQSEARTLLTFDKGQLSPEQLRDRIAAARDAGLFRVGQAAAGDGSRTEASVDPDENLYSLAGARRPHVADAHPDLNADEQAALRKIAPRTVRQRAIDWYREHTDRLMTKLRRGLVDKYAALKEMDEELHGTDFLESSITSSAWVLARMAPAAAGALNAMMHNGRIILDGEQKVIGMRDDFSMGLGEVFSRLGDAAEIERFMGWIAGNRAAKLAAEGRENLFDAKDIAALQGINRGNTADGRSRAKVYDEVFREFQQYRDDVLDIAEQTGIISPENRAMWRDEFYVPFYRVMDEEAKAGGPRAAKGLTRQEAYKKLKGGKQNLNDLLENTLMNFHHLLTASLKNQAAQQAITNAEQLGIAKEVPEAARDPKTSTFVLKAGQRVFYQIDDALVFEALTSLADPGLNNLAVRVMSGFKRVFTNMTTITLQFIVANYIRDTMQAAATSPVSKNVIANMFNGVKSFRDEKTRARMLASGGAFSFGHIYGADPEEVKAGLRRGLRGAKLVDGPKLVPKLLMAGWDAYNEFANTAENANRAAIFVQNQDKGSLRAAYEARDLMDFSQEGAWPAVRFLIRVVPFLNARLQGLDKLYRSGVKPSLLVAFGKGTESDKQAAARFGVVTGALALASIALYLSNHDDEEYRKLEDWQKDSYWFFRIGDQAFFIPKPFEVGAVSTLAERLTEQLVDDKANGKLLRDRLWAMITQTFAFSPVPQAFQPALDVYSNKDAFTGRPIESAGMERVSPTLRARATTTAPAHLISEATSVLGDDFTLSPLQADHLIGGYLGQVGAWGAGMVDTIWRTAKGESEPAKRWHEYQPIRRFYKDLGAPAPYDRYSTLFYEGLKESGRVYADVKRLQELGKMDEARELVGEKRDVLALRKPLGGVQRQLSTINARMDMVRQNGWDGERKRAELDRLLVIKNRLTEMAGKRIEKMRADD